MRCFNALVAAAHQVFGVALLIVGCIFPLTVSAGCGFSGASQSSSHLNDLVFEYPGGRIIGQKFWSNDSRYPVGSVMGVDRFTLQPTDCGALGANFAGRVAIVYRPPEGAVKSGGNTYRVASDAPGVAMEIEFPTGTAHPSGGILLAQSVGNAVSGGITVIRAQFSPFPVRLSMVKTGEFSSDEKLQEISFKAGGLGKMSYYLVTDPSRKGETDNIIKFPVNYGNYLGRVFAANCKLNNVGGATNDDRNSLIKMEAVSSNDFNGVGAIDKSSKDAKLWFSCSGTELTKPAVYFEATYPFDNGISGVGMPKENSDVGVQLLFNEKNIRFGERSSYLEWKQDLHNKPVNVFPFGTLTTQGVYCEANCGDTMTGPNWVEGGVMYKNNNGGFDSKITVKYYQTTKTAPKAQSFSVPFTVTIEWQ